MKNHETSVIMQWTLGPGMKVKWGPAIDDLDEIVEHPNSPVRIVEMRAIYAGDEPGPSTLQLVRCPNNVANFQMIGGGIKYAFAQHRKGDNFTVIRGDAEAWEAFEATTILSKGCTDNDVG
jgi:hypothetical protein